jgi:hypothetical protein
MRKSHLRREGEREIKREKRAREIDRERTGWENRREHKAGKGSLRGKSRSPILNRAAHQPALRAEGF